MPGLQFGPGRYRTTSVPMESDMPDPSPDPADDTPERPRLLKMGSVLLASIVGIPWLCVIASQVALEAWVQSAEPSDARIEELLAAQSEVDRIEAFAPISRTRDAGEVLNRHIALDMEGHDQPAVDEVWWTHISDDEEHIKEDWLDRPDALRDDAGVPLYDDSILKAILDYDHWDVASSGAYRTYLDAPSGSFEEQPIPNWVGLQHLAKVRLNRGLHERDVLPALQEVRHLARLLLHNESGVAIMVGLSLLSAERNAAEQAVEGGILQPGEWKPVSAEEILLARRTFFDIASFMVLSDPEPAESLFAGPLFAGRCAMLDHGAVALMATQHSMGTRRAPFEADFISLRDRYFRLRSKSGCTLEHQDRFISPQPGRHHSNGVTGIPYMRGVETATVLHLVMSLANSGE